MGILDSGSAPPTYVEPGEDRRQAGLFGLQMAQPFIQSYQSALGRSEQARQFDLSQRERVREFDLMAPLRAANVSHIEKQNSIADATLKSMTFKNDAEAMASQANAAYEGKKASALGFELQLGGDYSPQNQAKFLDFMSKNADLDRSPWATRMRENFASGQKYAQELKLVQERERAYMARDVVKNQEIADRQKVADARRLAASTGIKTVDDSNPNNPVVIEDAYQQALQKTSPEAKQTLPIAERNNYTAKVEILNKSDDLDQLIQKAESKGEKFWIGYSKMANAKSLAPIPGMSAEENDLARSILQNYADIFGVKGFGTAGKNFTPAEMSIVKAGMSNPDAVDFPKRFRQFRKATALESLDQLDNWKDMKLDQSPKYKDLFPKGAARAFAVPGVREAWSERRKKLGMADESFGVQGAATTAAPTNAPALPAGWKFNH